MKLNHKSWHYRMANYGMKRIWREDKTDFCSYSRMVMIGSFLWIAARAIILGYIGWTLRSFYQFYLYLKYGTPIDDGTEFWVLLFISTVFAISTVAGITKLQERKERNRGNYTKKEPGFFGLMYRKWKEKTCFMVEID